MSEGNARGLSRARRWWDMITTGVGVVILLALITLGEFIPFLGPVRLVLGFAAVLFVPGYWLVGALFPEAEGPSADWGQGLDSCERVGLSLGLSVAWVPLLALALDRLPWGIRLWPIALGELASVVLFMAVAVWRRERLSAVEAFRPNPPRPRAWWQGLETADRLVYCLVAGALAIAAGATAWVFLAPSADEFLTEFYILGAVGLAEEYPREAAVGEEISVTAGITNREREALTYTVEMWALDPWSEARSQVGEAGPVRLEPGETWEEPLNWRMPQAGEDQQVRFLLFREGETEAYRSLRLWLDVGKAEG